MIHSVLRSAACFVLSVVFAALTLSCERSRAQQDSIVGVWKLAALEEASADGRLHPADCSGLLILTSDGRMSVQVMYRGTRTGPTEYAQGGYEASFGRYQVDEQAQSFTYQVEGALVRTLVGKHLKRIFPLKGSHLVVTPPTADEHWRATWERYDKPAQAREERAQLDHEPNQGGHEMNDDKPQSPLQKSLGDLAPKLVELTDNVLFADVWERPQLSKRDRSLITCAALIAMGKTEQMDFHLPRALENGVTQEELMEAITHLAFYAGWPNAMSAANRAKTLFAKKETP